MTEMIDIIIISTLGCVCIYLLTKQQNAESTLSEKIPLLEKRESELEELERELKERAIKFKARANEVEEKSSKLEELVIELEEQKSLLRVEKNTQQSLVDVLTARSKLIEINELKLKDDICLFQAERKESSGILKEKALKVEARATEVEERASEVKAQIVALEDQKSLLQKKESMYQSLDDELTVRLKGIKTKEAKLIDDVRLFEVKRLKEAQNLETIEQELKVSLDEQKLKSEEWKSREKHLKSKEFGLENREKEVESQIESLQSRAIELESKADELERREIEVHLRVQKLESREKVAETKEKKLKEDLILLEKKREQLDKMAISLRDEKEKLNKLQVEVGKATDLLEKQRTDYRALEQNVQQNVQKKVELAEDAESLLKMSAAEMSTSMVDASNVVEEKAASNVKMVESKNFENNIQEVLVSQEEEDFGEREPTDTLYENTFQEKSDAEKRLALIKDELEILVKRTNETELSEDEPFDEDSLEALKKAAVKICYVKKFYDVMKDEFILFPSVAKTALDYRLIEEAEKFYFEEEDEYPADLSGGLRCVASVIIMEQEEDDMDEEYMNALAQDVEI